MNAKSFGMELTALVLVAVGWSIGQQPIVHQVQAGEKDKGKGTVGTMKDYPDTHVKGTVTYKGKRLNGGAIDINSDPPCGAAINPDGTFLMKYVPPGKYKVIFIVTGDSRKIEPREPVTDKKIQRFATTNVEIEVVQKKTNEVIIQFK